MIEIRPLRPEDDRQSFTSGDVDAKADAVEFYERYGFERLDVISGRLSDHPSPLPMFLPLGAIPAERKT